MRIMCLLKNKCGNKETFSVYLAKLYFVSIFFLMLYDLVHIKRDKTVSNLLIYHKKSTCLGNYVKVRGPDGVILLGSSSEANPALVFS